ncbi:MAG TPA: SH3 domain-containing protein [Anaerolineales bacterium]|nr:SH3 domain-containing protein [Anaerolineales bacterium]
MLNKHPSLTFISILLLASFACVLPGASAPAPVMDQNAINTSIAQDIAVRQTEAVLANPPTETPTSTPETPTLTLEPTITPTSDFTSTPGIPMISVSVDTNCRVGPGAIFQRVGILLVGETAEIIGREPKGEFWYIRNPDADSSGAEYCWVWGEYATISGNTLPLLFLSPPPPPATSFTSSFEKMQTCNVWWVDFKLSNTSGVSFRSINIVLTDTDTDPVTVVSLKANEFTHNDGCTQPVSTESLVAGETRSVSSPLFAYNFSGHDMIAKITLCTENNQQGTCVTQEINFKP